MILVLEKKNRLVCANSLRKVVVFNLNRSLCLSFRFVIDNIVVVGFHGEEF